MKPRRGKTIAFIPARGGSKSIPLKNIRTLNGRPLVYWVINAAEKCGCIDWVYVATDSEKIKSVVNALDFEKVSVVDRSVESATDVAPTEMAMLEFAAQNDFDTIVLIQATSPMLRAEDLRKGFGLFEEEGTDSVMSVVRQRRFLWEEGKEGYAAAVNYDISRRPRRQEFGGYLVENGAFYITGRDALLKSGNRISGHIRLAEMPEESYFELDEPSDWAIVEKFMERRAERYPFD